ncbi:MAG: serine hydrolase domain-containing protein [Vulcanimicrobiaceae bacterium]
MIARTRRLDDVLGDAIGRRYTAAVLRVERGGVAVFERAYGTLDGAADARATTVRTRFDLASLTKIVVAHAALDAVAAGALDLDGSLVRWFPAWRETDHAAIGLRMLLAHTSGMQSGADYRTLFDEDVETYALGRALVARPGERVVYSDLGFIALGALLARARGASLRAVVVRALAAVGARHADYRPRNDDAAAIAATECDAWRGRVRGAVHDEKAYLMNGVAGHAGLFGTAADVARVTDVYLGAATGRRPASLARDATQEHGADPVLRRGLGWALKTGDANSCGTVASARTFGHTGFTGTCVWADPDRDVSVVLLTNAVYFGRRDLRDLRAAVCDAAFAAFG